eukprot:1048914-Rhodomonas_salina.1
MELEGAAGGGESKTTEQGRIAWAGQMRSEVKRKKGVRDVSELRSGADVGELVPSFDMSVPDIAQQECSTALNANIRHRSPRVKTGSGGYLFALDEELIVGMHRLERSLGPATRS